MILRERIKELVRYSGLTIPKFANYVGFKTPQAVRELVKGNTKTLSDAAIIKILKAYPEISNDWLLTGEGKMLGENTAKAAENASRGSHERAVAAKNKGKVTCVPLIHIDSVGGVHSSNALESSEQYVEGMIPFPNARPGDVAILQSGNSMAPTIPAGAVMQIRRVANWQEYFGYGGDFVLWLTDERRITKQVLKYESDPKNYVTCHSYNPESADEELPKFGRSSMY